MTKIKDFLPYTLRFYVQKSAIAEFLVWPQILWLLSAVGLRLINIAEFLWKKLTKLLLGESLPPSAPEVVDGNERQMTIKWKAPIDDGGRPITGSQINR